MPDREKLTDAMNDVKAVENFLRKQGESWYADILSDAFDTLAMLREQEVGKWIKLQGMAPPEYHGHKICSVCESFAPYDPIHPWREMLSPYCPGCGAKMEVSGDA